MITLNGTTGITTPDITTDDLTVDTNTLYVDATNNRVGIGTSSPSNPLDVVGSIYSSASINADNGTTHTQIGIAGTGQGVVGTASNHALQVRTNGTERMRITSGGEVYMGTTTDVETSGNCTLHLKMGTTSGTVIATRRELTTSARQIAFYNPNGQVGSIQTSGTSTSYVTSSDYRLKANIVPMSDSIDRLKQLKPSTWSWIQDGSHGEGFLAHEAQTVVPEAVSGEKDAVEVWKEGDELPEGVSVGDVKTDEDGNTIPVYQGIDQSKLVPLLTAALQEAIIKIEALEARVATLEGN